MVWVRIPPLPPNVHELLVLGRVDYTARLQFNGLALHLYRKAIHENMVKALIPFQNAQTWTYIHTFTMHMHNTSHTSHNNNTRTTTLERTN